MEIRCVYCEALLDSSDDTIVALRDGSVCHEECSAELRDDGDPEELDFSDYD